MSSKMYLLSFTLANCGAHDVEPIAVSSEIENLKARAELHADQLSADIGDKETVGKWTQRWHAPLLIDGEDSQEMYYTIAEVEEV